MFEIKTQRLINAPIEAIWKCLMDTHNYPIWNTFIRKIEGNFIKNQKLKIKITTPDNQSMVFTPICIRVEKNKEIRWVGKMGFEWIFRGEHYFILEKISDYETNLIHAEKFSGILSNVFKKLKSEMTRKGFEVMNSDLSNYLSKNQSF